MKTSRIILSATAAASIALLASCLGSDTPSTESLSFRAGTSVVATDGSSAPQAYVAEYRTDYNLSSGYVTVSSDNLYAGAEKIPFRAEMPFRSQVYSNGDIRSFSSASDLQMGGFTLSGISGNMISIYNPSSVAGIPAGIRRVFNMSFSCDGKKVTVFDLAPYFGGTTETRYVNAAGQPTVFKYDELIYAVDLDVEKGKANVTFYNARFASEMPVKLRFRLEDLDLAFTSSGYSITGTGIVPQVFEGSDFTPNKDYTFKSFSLAVSGQNYNTAMISYVVTGKKSDYTGTCLASQFNVED